MFALHEMSREVELLALNSGPSWKSLNSSENLPGISGVKLLSNIGCLCSSGGWYVECIWQENLGGFLPGNQACTRKVQARRGRNNSKGGDAVGAIHAGTLKGFEIWYAENAGMAGSQST
jgi:hypothetical protein